MIQRYDVYDRDWDMAFNTVMDQGGEWVKHEDCKRLEDALKEILAAKNAPHYGDHDAALDHLYDAINKHAHLVEGAAQGVTHLK